MLKGIFLIIGAATCWGMGGVAGQYLYQYHDADMIWLCMARQILAGCMFLLFAAFVQKQDIFAILKADTLNIIEFSFLGILGAQLGFRPARGSDRDQIVILTAQDDGSRVDRPFPYSG